MCDEFLDMTPKSQRIKNTRFIKIKNSALAKYTVQLMKKQGTDWDKIFSKHLSDKDILSKYKNNSYNSGIRK